MVVWCSWLLCIYRHDPDTPALDPCRTETLYHQHYRNTIEDREEQVVELRELIAVGHSLYWSTREYSSTSTMYSTPEYSEYSAAVRTEVYSEYIVLQYSGVLYTIHCIVVCIIQTPSRVHVRHTDATKSEIRLLPVVDVFIQYIYIYVYYVVWFYHVYSCILQWSTVSYTSTEYHIWLEYFFVSRSDRCDRLTKKWRIAHLMPFGSFTLSRITSFHVITSHRCAWVFE